MRMFSVSLAGKKSRRWFAGVEEKCRCWLEGEAVVAASRRPTTEEVEPEETYAWIRGATARLSWLACLGEQILVLTRGVNIEVDGL